jgi:hypothetical protein
MRPARLAAKATHKGIDPDASAALPRRSSLHDEAAFDGRVVTRRRADNDFELELVSELRDTRRHLELCHARRQVETQLDSFSLHEQRSPGIPLRNRILSSASQALSR